MYMKMKCVVLVILGLVAMSFPVSAEFDDSWDWHNVTVDNKSQYKTEVHYCFDSNVTDQWKNWTREAANNWNDAKTGWKLTESTTVPCQVTIKLKDIPASENSGGARVTGFGSRDANGRISNLSIEFDTNLSDELWNGKAPSGWNTTGNNSLDPVVVAMHEFGHVLRMKHTNDGTDTGNLEDPVSPGNHNATLSGSDKNESKNGTIIRKANTGNGSITPAGGNMEFSNTKIIFREGSLYETANVFIRPLSHISTPEPTKLPEGTDAIIIGVDVYTNPAIEVLEIPATVIISYTSDDLSGAYFIGDQHRVPFGQVNEFTLKAFSYDRENEQWSEVEDSVLDMEAKTITFDTNYLGFIGIGASAETLIEAEPVEKTPGFSILMAIGLLSLLGLILRRKE